MTHQTISATLAELLLKERMVPLVAHLVAFGIVALLVSEAMPLAAFGIWGGVVVVVIGARAALWGYARRLPSRRATEIVWATMVALGLAWGVGTAVAAYYVTPTAFAFLLLAVAGLMAGGIATLTADRWVYPLYAVAIFGPVLVAVPSVLSGRLEGVAIALVLVFVGFTVRLHQQAHQTLCQRLQVEAELRHREHQLASAQAIAHVGSWEFDMVANRVTWSDEAYHLWGLPLGSPVDYHAFIAGVHPDDRTRVEQVVGEGLAQRRNIEFECRIVRPEGDVRHLLNRNVVVTNGKGEPIRLTGTCLDITERKMVEERLRASLAEVKVLEGILPICATCKRVRTDGGQWEAVESYVRERTDAEFSHGLCPDCAAKTWR